MVRVLRPTFALAIVVVAVIGAASVYRAEALEARLLNTFERAWGAVLLTAFLPIESLMWAGQPVSKRVR